MKKKELLNEIMGVPKAVDFWVDNISWIVTGVVAEIVDGNNFNEIDINYNKDGQQKSGKAYRSTVSIDGNDFMSYLSESTGLDLKELLKNQNFKNLPLYKPTLDVSLAIIPDELYEQDFGSKLNPNAVEASHGHSSVTKLSKLGGDNLVLPKQEFTFKIYLPSDIEKFGSSEGYDDIRKLIKPTLSHELTHAYEAYNRIKTQGEPHSGQETFLNAAARMMSDRKYPQWNNFLHLVYLHLSFEINARITQFYYSIKDNDIRNYDDFMRELKGSGVWAEIESLAKFNAKEFIDSFKGSDLGFEIMLNDLGTQKSRAQQGLPPILPKTEPKKALTHLIDGWDDVLQTLNTQIKKTGVYKGKFMDLVPEKAKKDPYYFFKFFEERFHDKARKFKKKIYKLSALVTDKSLMNLGENIVNKTQCSSCGHTWDISPKDDNPYLCHMCGYDSMKKEYNEKEMLKFWDKEIGKDL